MSGVISRGEGNGWIAASWVFRNIVRLTLPHLDPDDKLGPALVTAVEINLLYVELSDFSDEEIARFHRALQRAYAEAERAGSGSFADPSFYDGFMARFRELLKMLSHQEPVT